MWATRWDEASVSELSSRPRLEGGRREAGRSGWGGAWKPCWKMTAGSISPWTPSMAALVQPAGSLSGWFGRVAGWVFRVSWRVLCGGEGVRGHKAT